MATTEKPTNLSITRDGWKFKITWKKPGSKANTNQDLDWYIDTRHSKWSKSVSVGKAATSATITPDHDPDSNKDWKTLHVRVRRKVSGKSWSDYATASYSLSAPDKPGTPSFASGSEKNTGEFTCEYTGKTGAPLLKRVRYQTHEQRTRTGYKKDVTSGWTDFGYGDGDKSKTISVTADNGLFGVNGDGRVIYSVRMRSKGWSTADSKDGSWKTHIWCYPKKPYIDGAYYKGGTLSVHWNYSDRSNFPVDTAQAQYALAVPESDESGNLSCPDGLSWQDNGDAFVPYDSSDSSSEAASLSFGDDECLFVRVVAEHDGYETVSDPVRVSCPSEEHLASPTLGTVEMSADGTIRVEYTNNSAVEHSYIAVLALVNGSAEEWTDTIESAYCASGQTYTYEGTITGYDSVETFRVGIIAYSAGQSMCSAKVWFDVSSVNVVPAAPANLALAAVSDEDGTVLVSWESDSSSTKAVISWSESPYAWSSTASLNTYEVESTKATSWYITGLDTGTTWYVAVRLVNGELYGPWSSVASISLSETPDSPQLVLTPNVVTLGGTVAATWAYTCADGSSQQAARLAFCTTGDDGEAVLGSTIATEGDGQLIEFDADADGGFEEGTTYLLGLATTSTAGMTSSVATAELTVAPEFTAKIASTSLVESEEADDDGNAVTVYELTELPLAVTVEGGDSATVVIERAAAMNAWRPDGTEHHGYDGETMAIATGDSGETLLIDVNDLEDVLDDTGEFRIVATVSDSYGQTDTAELAFRVAWAHQPTAPELAVEFDKDDETIRVKAVNADDSDEAASDYIDIYRLSADLPRLIVSHGSFDTWYVDPYPAFGEMGGVRVVAYSEYGDCITEDGAFAYADSDGASFGRRRVAIEWADGSVELPYNIETDSSWEKDFELTRRLDGSMDGGWNVGVQRTVSIGADVIGDDTDLVRGLRALAEWAGVCHVRTREGSSFAADVQVSESVPSIGKAWSYDLTITRVDVEKLDGVTLDDWEAEYE